MATTARRPTPFLRLLALLALPLALSWSDPPPSHAAGAANDHTVLILGPTVTGGAGSVEAQKAMLAGMDVEIVTAAGWPAKSAADFGTYRALILGDPTCQFTGPELAATANTSVWAPQVDGNVIIIGTDEVFHDFQGGNQLSESGIAFAVDEIGKTGAFISLSCYNDGATPMTPVPLLDGFSLGGFTVTGVNCHNDSHIVAVHPALAGTTDATLSNWSCSVHEGFDSWPADFQVLAIAENLGMAFTASDGTVGTPYILARGAGLVTLGLSVSPSAATNPVGTSHTVTATLIDSNGSSVAGALIGFDVIAGPNTGAVGTCIPADCKTNAMGQVTFTYTDTAGPGTDTIQAFVDQNTNGSADVGEPQALAQKTWSLAVTTTTSTPTTTTTTTTLQTVVDHMQCFEVKPGFFPITTVAVEDQFGAFTEGLRAASRLCAPTDKNGEGITDPTDYLTGYRTRGRTPRFTKVLNNTVVDQFGTLKLDVVHPDLLMVPTSVDGVPQLPPLDHFQCYKVKRSQGSAKFVKRTVSVTNGIEPALILNVLAPYRLCAPANKNGEDPTAPDHVDHLLCYKTRGPRFTGSTHTLDNQFGPQTARLIARRELCLPALKNPPPTTTTTSTVPTTSTTVASTTTTTPTTSTTTTTLYGSPSRAFLTSTDSLLD